MGAVLKLVDNEAIKAKHEDISDAELVQRARRGETLAEERLYRRHVRMAYGLAHRLLGGRDVEDVVQDSFLDAFAKLSRLDDPQAFARWLGSIVINNARSQLRSRKRWLRFKSSEDPHVIADALVATNASPELREELVMIYSVVDKLPEDTRIALILRRTEGLKIAEVADLMGCSPATVKRRIQDADFFIRAAQEKS